MIKNKVKKLLHEHPNLLKFSASIYHVFTFVSIIIFRLCSAFFYFIPIKERLVISNFDGKGFFDNPKYIVKHLRAMDCTIEVIWFVDEENKETIPKELNIKTVKPSFWNQLYYLSTSSIWLDTFRKKFIPMKKDSQFYIQLWHGGLGMKKVESSLDLTFIHKFSAYLDTKNTDIMISNSNHLTNIYRRDFNYDGPIFQIGYPMNDVLFKQKDQEKRDVLKILYVPTFRGDEREGEIPYYFPDFQFLVKKFQENDMNVQFIVRVHPSLNLNVDNMYENLNIVNGNDVSDIKELITEVDMVVSDYSSAIFDCVVTKTPGIIYAKDYTRYAEERGLYYKLEDLPFPYCFDNEGLAKSIMNFNMEQYGEQCEVFIQKMGLVDDGDSSERFYLLLKHLLEHGVNKFNEENWLNWIK